MSVIKNSAWNVFGLIIPSVVAFPALGVLSRNLSIEEFGIFTLSYAIIGYASIFDAGLSKAVTRSISAYRDNVQKKLDIMGTAISAVLILSFIATVLLFCTSKEIVSALSISSINQYNSITVFKLLSFCIPPFILNFVLQAYLEGLEKFRSINIQKVVTGSLMAGLPVLFLLVDKSLVAAIFGLVVARYICCFTSLYFYQKYKDTGSPRFTMVELKELFSYGGWLTVSSVISPIMVYFDRFILSAQVGATAVGFYTAPSEIISKLLAIPYAISRALFPKLSKQQQIDDAENIKISTKLITISCLLIVIPLYFFSGQILTLWLGEKFTAAHKIFEYLLIGFFFNGLAQIPFTYIQAKGYSKYASFMHLLEVIPYIILLLWLSSRFGAQGVAVAWVIRVFIDLILCLILASRVKKWIA